ncbi:MAG: MFS transporter [Rikenellaceae bacterium]
MAQPIQAPEEWDGVAMPARFWAILAALFAVSLGVLDGVIANLALPTIAADLGVSPSESIWIVNSYQISIVVSLLLFAALGDFWGYKRIYLAGLVLFMVTSVGCAMSWNLNSLIFFRVIQGIGASAVMSINTSVVRIIYPRKMLGRGLGINSTVVSVTAALGPTVAGAILAVTDWSWLFLVNIPLGVVAILLGLRYIPENPVLQKSLSFKWRDALLHIASLGLLFAVVTSLSHGVAVWTVVSLGVALVVVGYIYVRSQLKREYPILPFDLLKIPIFSLSVVTSILSFVAHMSTMVALPFFLQVQLGCSAVETGLLIAAWPALNMVTAPIAGFLVERLHAGILGGVGLLILTVALFSLGAISQDDFTSFDIVWRLAMCGLGFGLFQPPNNSVLIASAPLQRSGSASGMMATSRLVGQTFGAALVAMLFYFIPQESANQILYISGGFAAVATILSLSRLSLPLPKSLQREEVDAA